MNTDLRKAMVLAPALVAGLLLLACGDSVQPNIKKLEGTQQEREEAKMLLTLAKRDAIDPLVHALGDAAKPTRARLDVAEVLFRLYLREDEPRILKALVRALSDPEPAVRAGAAQALGLIEKPECVPPLLDALEKETDDDTADQILAALEPVGWRSVWQPGGIVLTQEISEVDRGRLVRILKGRAPQTNRNLERRSREWLEVIAETIAHKAAQLVLQARLQEAESLYLEAKAIVPDSKNINQKLGKFYYGNGDEDKGLAILAEHGFVTHAKCLSPPPVIDGVLDDRCWEKVKPITEFYQCIYNMAAYPIEGKSEAYVGYAGESFFVAVKGYEPSTETITAKVTKRDGEVWTDDDVDIYIDMNHDYKTYCQIVINSLGAVFDTYRRPNWDPSWNGNYTVGTAVEDTFWTCEIEIPLKEVGDTPVKRGTVWGFNVCRVRIGNASEFGQWVPTYGAAHRPERFGFLFFD